MRRRLPLIIFLLALVAACLPAWSQHEETIRLSNKLNEMKPPMFDYSLYLLDQEIAKNPEHVSLLKLQKARTLFMQNKAAEAEAIINAIPASDPHYLFARFVFGTNAIEKGRNEIGVQALEAYVNSFSEANRPQGDNQRESFLKAIFYLKHGYEQLGLTDKAMEIGEKRKLLHEDVAGSERELKLQQLQAKLDSAEIIKQTGEDNWQALCNEVLEPLRELMWEQDLITAIAHIERARALCILGQEKEGLAIFNDRNIWNFIIAFDEPFKSEGMLYAAPAAKAFLWRGHLHVGIAEKAENDQDKKKAYIAALRAFVTVLEKYEKEKSPYYNVALSRTLAVRDILQDQFDLKITLPGDLGTKQGVAVDLSVPDRHFQDEAYDRALPLYIAALHRGGRQSETAAELIFKAAYCYLQTGQYLEAMALAGMMGDQFPDDQTHTPIILLQVGEALWAKRDEDQQTKEDALRVYAWYVQACPLHQYAAPISTRVANDWYGHAIELAQEANRMPAGPEKVAKNLEAQEAFKAAVPMYEHIIGNYGHTEEGLRSFRLLAACYTSSRQFDKGAEVFLKYIEQEMKRDDADKRDLANVADAKYRAAQNYVQAGQNLDRQARRLREQAETAPADPPPPAEGEAPAAEPDEDAPPTAGQLNDQAAILEAEGKNLYLKAVEHVDELVGPWREANGRLHGHQSERADKAIEGTYELLGWAYDGAGEKDKACLAFTDFIKRYPDPEGTSRTVPRVMFRLAMLYLEMDKVNEAGQVLETLSNKYPEEGQKALPRLASAMYDVERFDKAIEAYRKIFTENLAVEVSNLLWAATNLWNCKGRHPQEGAELALKAINLLLPMLDKPDLEAWLGRNRAREIADDDDEVARTVNNFRERLHFQGGSAGLHAGKPEAAIAFLDVLLQNDKTPYFIDGRFLRAEVNRKLKKHDQAIADFSEIAQVCTFSGRIGTYFRAQCMIGDTFIDQENYSRALGAFEIIARTDPDDEDESRSPEEHQEQRQWIEYAVYRAAFCYARLGMANERDEMTAKYRRLFSGGRFIREIGNLPGPAGANAP